MSAVVYVEPEDDVRSILAKMERVTGGTVGVIVPAGRATLNSAVSLRLIRRQAEALGLELGLVTPDLVLQNQSRAEGIRVYRSPAAYERAIRRRNTSAGSPVPLDSSGSGPTWATFAAVAVLLLVIVAAVLAAVPEMIVVVSPRTTVLSETVQVVADPAQSSIDVERQRIPARSVLLSVDAVDQAAPGEGEPAGDGKARGLVTFTNRTQDLLDIPAGTILATVTGARFMTEQSAVLPAGIGQTTKAPVVAEVPGDQGNVPRLRITGIQGILDAKVYVQNEEPTAGGGIPGSHIVTAVDRDRLLKRVSDKARSEAEAQIRKSLGQGELLVGQSLQFTPLETTFDGEVGQDVATLGVHLHAQMTGLVVNSGDLDRVGLQAWDPLAPPGFEVVPGSIKASAPEVISVAGRTTLIRLRLEATSRAQIDTGQMERLARWRSAAEASLVLSRAYDLSRPPEVRFTPTWAQRAYRVQVVVDPAATLAAR